MRAIEILKNRLVGTGLFLLAFTFYALPVKVASNPAGEPNSRNDTMFIYNDVFIPENDSLVIDPGTVVMFMGHHSIHVQGKLLALGTATDSIKFTLADTTGFHDFYSGAGGWNGIRFEDTPAANDSSLMAYCHFEFGKAVGDSAASYGGAIRLLRFNKVRISHCTFENNFAYLWGGAIHALKSSIFVEHSNFKNNLSGSDNPEIWGYGGGMSFVSSDPTIRFCNFIDNVSTGTGGGIMFEYSNPEMINCIFTGNHSALGGGLSFVRSQPDRTIANILVYNNTAEFFGGGISNITGSPILTNFTITGNYAAMGGGYYCNEEAHPKLFNSILWDNTSGDGFSNIGSQIWIWNVSSAPSFYNCNIQFGYDSIYGYDFISAYENNIEADPLFSDPEMHDFSLQQFSPCINAGTSDTSGLNLPAFDLAMNDRIIHDIIDMGAYEYDGPLNVKEIKITEPLLYVSPNPVNHSSVVHYMGQNKGTVNFYLLNLQGSLIASFEHPMKNMGLHRFELHKLINFNSLPSGVYVLRAGNPNYGKSVKILVL